jgi:WD40 repeat protein
MVAVHGRKFISFALDPSERWALTGNLLGHVSLVDVDTFEVAREVHAHAGSIEAVAFHPTLPYAASVSSEHTLVLWRFDADGGLSVLHRVMLRDFPTDEPERHYPTLPLQSTALCFHPRERKLLTRNATAAVLELRFDDARVEPTLCRRYFQRRDVETGADTGEADEVTFVHYVEGLERVFVGGAGGHLVLLDTADMTRPVGHWNLGEEAVHQCTHIDGSRYLIASDTRRTYSLDLRVGGEPVANPIVTRDHLERVFYNRAADRAYASSFDRNIYEVDPRTGASKGIVVETPFKCRWIHALERDPSTLVVQCRNGALYKCDLATKSVRAFLKETPDSFWTAVATDERTVLVAGEGPHVLRLEATGADPRRLETRWSATWQRHDAMNPGAFTKRMALHQPTGSVLHGRSDGTLVLVSSKGRARVIADVGAAVRDVAVAEQGFAAFVACEDGSAHRVDLETGRVDATWRSATGEPLWSLAYCHTTRRLAVLERMGTLDLLHADTLAPIKTYANIARAKRARWVRPGVLLACVGGGATEIDVDRDEVRRVIDDHPNTAEDLDWSDDGRFLAVINYDKELWLYDAKTYDVLHRVSIDIDYPHGLLWLSPRRAEGAWPYELITFGRSGMVDRFRVHDERVFHLGVMNDPVEPVAHHHVTVR